MGTICVTKWLLGAHEKYQFVKRLLEESKNDPPNEPYKSKYRAKEILQKIETELGEYEVTEVEDVFQVCGVSALLNYEMGVISMETEEPSEAEKHFQNAWDTIKEHAPKQECVALTVSILNELGILWAGRNEVQKAHDYLKQAECLYFDYHLKKNPCPLMFDDLFLKKDLRIVKDDWTFFEKALTLTLYYLAQVYGHLGDSESSAKYCHITLKRQLDSKDYDPLEWSINCATLSQYFIAKEKFSAARHVLACANYMISEYEENLKKGTENEDEENSKKGTEDEEKLDQFRRKKADVGRCWTKYALHLLISSRDEQLMGDSTSAKSKEEDPTEDFAKIYQLIKESKVKEFENQVTCNLVSDYDGARAIYLFGQEQLKFPKEFYILDEYTYDYVEIVQDHSKLYKFLAFFERIADRKCKMHKRRIDMLEDVLEKLNIQFYLALCRQLMFELAETYSEMMDLKYVIYSAEKPNVSPHSWRKINFLVAKSIEHYKAFIESLKDTKKQMPEVFSDDVARPALVAHFCLGRLHSKFIAERMVEIENLRRGDKFYKFVINYIEKHPDHEKYIKNELPVIKEMVELLPAKIQKIHGVTLF